MIYIPIRKWIIIGGSILGASTFVILIFYILKWSSYRFLIYGNILVNAVIAIILIEWDLGAFKFLSIFGYVIFSVLSLFYYISIEISNVDRITLGTIRGKGRKDRWRLN
jgi:hypothetical protein